MGTLYVVGTPIGNLGDMTPRAVQTLRSVSLIAAEDTRHTARLLQRFDIETPMISYHQHNEVRRTGRLLDALAEGDVALVTDAGTPAVSDPGAVVVRAVRQAGYPVVPIPGPSSLVAAVSASGLVDGPFLFQGFLPRAGEERRVALARGAASGVPLVLFESPNRLIETLGDLQVWFGNVEAVVARELTKLHEDIRSGPLAELHDHFASEDDVRGEICLVVEAAVIVDKETGEDPSALARRLLADGMKPSKAARELAKITGMTSERAYEVIRSAQDPAPRVTNPEKLNEGGD
ncbi:MAG TPA: 16S rRNA (cytidine(1402)-2'-O)-methyltransferase [Thermomicrobiales bacterium]|nr:16S rRNA (cytidine(1402)-2'-O)-methyltransferase [Thermomicrobiales bacterium]